MQENRIKGIAFRSFVKSLTALRGEAALTATLELLEPELAHKLRNE